MNSFFRKIGFLLCATIVAGCSINIDPAHNPREITPVKAKSIFSGKSGSASVIYGISPILVTGSNEYDQLGFIGKDVILQMERLPALQEEVKKIVIRDVFSLILTKDGRLYASGKNDWGQFGDGTLTSHEDFTEISENVSDVSAGDDFIAIIKDDGSLLTAGNNDLGQLGTGNTDPSTSFTKVADDAATVEAYGKSLLFLGKDKSLWGFGSNVSGELGMGDIKSQLVPKEITAAEVNVIAMGAGFSIIVYWDHSAYSSGDNSHGQLALGNTVPRKMFTKILFAGEIKKISLGDSHTLVLTKNGELFVAGNNTNGQLGLGSTIDQTTLKLSKSNVSDISATSNGSMYVDNAQYVYASGDNEIGELGLGHSPESHNFERLYKHKTEERVQMIDDQNKRKTNILGQPNIID